MTLYSKKKNELYHHDIFNMFKIITLFLFTSIFVPVFGQNKLKGAQKESRKLYDDFNYYETIAVLEPMKNKDVDMQRKLAISYDFVADYPNSELYYAAICNSNERVPSDILNYAKVLMKNKKYAQAELQMKSYSELNPTDQNAKEFNRLSVVLQQFTKKGEAITIENLAINSPQEDFSPFVHDNQFYFASSRSTSKWMIRKWNGNQLSYLDVYHADLNDSEITNIQPLNNKEVNEKYHDGPVVFSADGNEMFVTRNNYSGVGKDGVKNLKLLVARKEANGWTIPEPLPFNSSEYSVGHAAISSDGRVMVFASDMPGGKGGVDLYKVTRSGSNGWTIPENLSSINTTGDELFPFFHSTDMLLFASDGHAGYGGLDVFVGKWRNDQVTRFENVGAPLNSPSDDFSPWVNSEMNAGYFASNRTTDGAKGNDDIYSFTLNKPFSFDYQLVVSTKEIKGDFIPGTTVFLKNGIGELIDSALTDSIGRCNFSLEEAGKYVLSSHKTDYFDVTDFKLTIDEAKDSTATELILEKDPGFTLSAVITTKKNKTPIPFVKILLINNFTGEEKVMITDSLGAIRIPLEGKKLNERISYNLRMEKTGFLSKGTTYNRSLDKPGKYVISDEMNLSIEGIEVGVDIAKAIDLKPIYFDLGKSIIRSDAALELDKIVKIMNENPTMIVELGAHTDCRGPKSKNLSLSQKRAVASAKYIKLRINDSSRIYGKGYGESKLLNNCSCEGKKAPKYTDAQHAVNRRTEFIIIKM